MDKNLDDAIAQYATGKVLFENEARISTYIVPANESDVALSNNSSEAHSPGQTEQPKTLADLVAQHVPAHQQAKVLARIYQEFSEKTTPINDQSNELG